MKSLRYPVLLLVLAVAAAGVVTRGCIASSVTSRRDSAAAPSRTRGPNRRLDKHHSEYYLTLDSRVLLNDERSMPLLGLGTFQVKQCSPKPRASVNHVQDLEVSLVLLLRLLLLPLLTSCNQARHTRPCWLHCAMATDTLTLLHFMVRFVCDDAPATGCRLQAPAR